MKYIVVGSIQLLFLISSYKCLDIISFFKNVYKDKNQNAFSLFWKALINNRLVCETFEGLP